MRPPQFLNTALLSKQQILSVLELLIFCYWLSNKTDSLVFENTVASTSSNLKQNLKWKKH